MHVKPYVASTPTYCSDKSDPQEYVEGLENNFPLQSSKYHNMCIISFSNKILAFILYEFLWLSQKNLADSCLGKVFASKEMEISRYRQGQGTRTSQLKIQRQLAVLYSLNNKKSWILAATYWKQILHQLCWKPSRLHSAGSVQKVMTSDMIAQVQEHFAMHGFLNILID